MSQRLISELKYYIRAVYLSLFSRQFYADLISNKSILGIKYILILAVLMAVPISLEIRYIISNALPSDESSDQNLDYIEKQIPEMQFENGQFKINAEKNQSVTSKTGQLVAIFDVENKVDDLTAYDEVIIINAEGIRLKLPDNTGTAVLLANEVVQSLKQYFDKTTKGRKFNSKKFFEDVKQISKTPFIAILVFSAMWFFIKYLISAFIFSFAVGMFFAIICKRTKFDFRQCFRVAVFTATPVAVLESISNIMGGGLFSYASLVYFVTHMIYIHFAVESYKKSGK